MKKNILKIVIPVDFKEPSVKALHYAAYVAKKSEAELVLLYVIDTPALMAQFFRSTGHLVKITEQAKKKINDICRSIDFSPFFKAIAGPLGVIINKN